VETLTGATPATERAIHHEETRNYYFTTAGSGSIQLNLPFDVRHWTLGGPYFTIWNALGGALPITIKTFETPITVATLAVGDSVQLYLHDNSTGEGTWTALSVTSPTEGAAGTARFRLT